MPSMLAAESRNAAVNHSVAMSCRACGTTSMSVYLEGSKPISCCHTQPHSMNTKDMSTGMTMMKFWM